MEHRNTEVIIWSLHTISSFSSLHARFKASVVLYRTICTKKKQNRCDLWSHFVSDAAVIIYFKNAVICNLAIDIVVKALNNILLHESPKW